MEAVKVSSKYQVCIPKEIRKSMGITAGTSLQIVSYKDRIELIPVSSIENLRGVAKGIDTTVERG